MRVASVFGRQARSVGALTRRNFAAEAAVAPSGDGLEKTVLYDRHVELGGKMVPFAGYSMPVQYDSEGIKDSHLWVRSSAGIFDISHMGEVKLHGADRVAVLEKLVVADVAALAPTTSTLSVITNEQGGIIDDTIITNKGDHVALVINGACKHKDIAHFEHHVAEAKAKGMDVAFEVVYDREMFALQGPKAMQVLSTYIAGSGIDLTKMPFMTAQPMTILGADCNVTRCGYTVCTLLA